LQALDFAGHMVRGRMSEWLDRRGWKAMDLSTNLGGRRSAVMSFAVEMLDENAVPLVWEGRLNLARMRCTSERVQTGDRTMLELKEGRLRIADEDGVIRSKYEKLDLVYEGSVMSVLELSDAHIWLRTVKRLLGDLKSLELLSPQLLRGSARAGGEMGIGGERLPGVLAELPARKKQSLLDRLHDFYPWIRHWDIKTLQYGWKRLMIDEEFGSVNTVEAAHINDGFLRVIAILAELESNHSFLLFDEIENGINPELVEKLMDSLRATEKQVVITTHSPMILNYIPDDVAQDAVQMLYRDGDGATRTVQG
jgi:hypothetical protein